MQNATNPVLQLERISKSYPGVVALDQVNFSVHRNEMVGLVACCLPFRNRGDDERNVFTS